MTRQKIFFVWFFCLFGWFCCSATAQETAQDFNKKGVSEFRAGNLKEANELLQKAIKLNPNWAEPYYNLYLVLKSAKKIPDSRKYLKKAYDLEPNNPTYKDELTRLLKSEIRNLQSTSDKEKLKNLKNLLIQINPQELDVAVEIIAEHFAAKDYDKVKAMINSTLEMNKAELPKYSSGAIGEMFFMLAKIELENKEIKAALEHAEKATRYPLDHATEAKELYAEIKKIIKDMIQEYTLKGKEFVAKNEYNKAMEEFNKALAFDPENEAILSEIEKMDNQKQVKAWMQQADKLVAEQKWLEARDILEIVVKIQPKNADAKKNLQKAKEFEEGLMKKLGKAEKLPRTTSERMSMAETFLGMAKRFLEAQNYKEARISLDRVMVLCELDPKLEKIKVQAEEEISKLASMDNLKATWDKGIEAYKSREFEECLKQLSQLPQNYSPDILSYLSFCYWKMNDFEKAKEFAHRQLEKQPENNRAKWVLANIFHEAGDDISANRLALEIQKSDPDYPGIDDLVYKTGALRWGPLVIPILVVAVLLYIAYVIYNNLPEYYKNAGINRARSFLKKGMYKEAIEELNNVKKMPNITAYDGAVISRILAPAYLKNASYDKAIGECKHLIAINPNDAEAHQWLGYAYLGRRMISPESLPELLNLYKTEKKNVALLSLLGSHYTSQKTLSTEGVEVLERWYELEPNNPEVLKALGKYYLQKGKTDQIAMKVFESMMATGKAEPDFLLGVAKLHLRLNQPENCLKLCETVLTVDVNNELVHPILRDCYRKMGKIADLIEIYRAFLAENPYNVAFQKGLTEALKIAGKEGQAAANDSPPADAPPVVQLKDNEVICPHCQKINLNTDYYCQSCGKSIVQG